MVSRLHKRACTISVNTMKSVVLEVNELISNCRRWNGEELKPVLKIHNVIILQERDNPGNGLTTTNP